MSMMATPSTSSTPAAARGRRRRLTGAVLLPTLLVYVCLLALSTMPSVSASASASRPPPAEGGEDSHERPEDDTIQKSNAGVVGIVDVVPTYTLYSGATVPLVGLGCASGVRTTHVASALESGYRYLDTAQSYAWGYHEDEVGDAVGSFLLQHSHHPSHGNGNPEEPDDDSSSPSSSGQRAAVFVQTKVHPEDLGYEATMSAFSKSLDRLKAVAVDSVLIHKPRCWEGACSRVPQGTWQDSWRALSELHSRGKIRSAIGMCDVTPSLLDEMLRKETRPHLIQNWMDPFHQDKVMRSKCREEGVMYQAYSTLGTQWKHFRGYDENPAMTDPTLTSIARKYGVSVANVVINWAVVGHGVSVLPASTSADRQRSNLVDSFAFTLTAEELAAIDSLDGTLDDVPPPKRDRTSHTVSMVFENGGDESVEAYWVGHDEGEVSVGEIGPNGGELRLDSYHGHRFVFRGGGGGGGRGGSAAAEVVGRHTVNGVGGSTPQRHVVVRGDEL